MRARDFHLRYICRICPSSLRWTRNFPQNPKLDLRRLSTSVISTYTNVVFIDKTLSIFQRLDHHHWGFAMAFDKWFDRKYQFQKLRSCLDPPFVMQQLFSLVKMIKPYSFQNIFFIIVFNLTSKVFVIFNHLSREKLKHVSSFNFCFKMTVQELLKLSLKLKVEFVFVKFRDYLGRFSYQLIHMIY